MAPSMVSIIKLLTAAWSFTALATAETIQQCGSQPYYPSQYTCYNGFRCPVMSGERTVKCAQACYLLEAYSCNNGKLTEHLAQQGGFTVHLVQPPAPALANTQLNACGGNFFLTTSKPCTECPAWADGDGYCAKATNTTIFNPDGSLKTLSGGQKYYVGSNGAFNYTPTNLTTIPAGGQVGATRAYDHGYFNYVGTTGSNSGSSSASGWVACPINGSWQVYAKRAGIALPGTCLEVKLAVTAAPRMPTELFHLPEEGRERQR